MKVIKGSSAKERFLHNVHGPLLPAKVEQSILQDSKAPAFLKSTHMTQFEISGCSYTTVQPCFSTRVLASYIVMMPPTQLRSESVFQPCCHATLRKENVLSCFVLSVTAEALWFSDHEGNQGGLKYWQHVRKSVIIGLWLPSCAVTCEALPLLASFNVDLSPLRMSSTAPRAFTSIGVASLATPKVIES